MKRYTFSSGSPAATFNLGRRLGEKLAAGSVIALTGELGCGKTLFTRGICAGLEVPLRQVNSPTFMLVNEYAGGRLPVFHIDLYRLGDAADGVGIGMLDYLRRAAGGVMLIEWAEKAGSLLPEGHLSVQFQALSARRRRLMFSGHGAEFAWLGELGLK